LIIDNDLGLRWIKLLSFIAIFNYPLSIVNYQLKQSVQLDPIFRGETRKINNTCVLFIASEPEPLCKHLFAPAKAILIDNGKLIIDNDLGLREIKLCS